MKLRLNTYIILSCIVAFIVSLLLTYKAYNVSVAAAEKNIYRYISQKAQHIHAIIELNSHKSEIEILQLVEKSYTMHTDYPDDEYLCIVDSNSVLLLHTKASGTVGIYVGKNHLNEGGKYKCNLEELVNRKENFTGHYISSAGEDQIAAFDHLHTVNWTIGIHRSKEKLYKEIKQQYIWLIITIIFIGAILFPVTILILIYSIRQYHKHKIKTEKESKWNIIKAKEKIEKRDAIHSSMIANISDVIAIISIDGTIKYKSPNVERSFGWKPDDFINQSAFMAIHPGDIDLVKREFQNLIESETNRATLECRYRCKNGEYKNIKLTAVNMIHDKIIEGVLINYHDITTRKNTEKALEESEYKHRILFENMQDAVCMLDNNGKITDVNKAGEKLFGYSRNEIIGMSVSEFIYYQDRERSAEYFKKLKEFGNYKMYEGRIVTKTGNVIWIQVSSSEYVQDSVTIGSQDIIRNITERKEIEEELSNQNRRLKESNATKDKFFSVIAHDLKNPISSTISLISLLNKNIDTYDVHKQKLFVKMIDEGLNVTFKLLDNLLLWSRSQTGVIKPRIEIINLHMLVKDTLQPIMQAANNKNITIDNNVTDSTFVNADKNLLSTIIRNLVSNAVKFTSRNGFVIISSQQFDNTNSGSYIQISVKDTGIGMSAEIKTKLFSITESRSTEGTDNETGTGLGLILCKEFVEKHGGNIWVESEEGKGSEFIFTIPNK